MLRTGVDIIEVDYPTRPVVQFAAYGQFNLESMPMHTTTTMGRRKLGQIACGGKIKTEEQVHGR